MVLFGLSSKAQFFYQGSCGSNAEFRVLYIDNDVFACTHFNALQFYSISNPAAPTLISSVSLGFSFPVLAVTRSGNHIFTQGYSTPAIFTVVDISNLSNPYVQGQCLWGNYTGIDIKTHNNFAYVLGYDSIFIYSISNFSAPSYFGQIAITSSSSNSSMLIKNNQLFVGNSNGLSIYDINANGTLSFNQLLSQITSSTEMTTDSLQETLFCSSTNAIQVYDFTQTNNPVYKYQLPVGGFISIKGNYLYSSSDSVNVSRIYPNSYVRVASMGVNNIAPVYDLDAKDSSIVLVCSRDSILTYQFNRNSTLGVYPVQSQKDKPYQLFNSSSLYEIEALENQLLIELFTEMGNKIGSYELNKNKREKITVENSGLYVLRIYSRDRKKYFSERIVLYL